MNLVFIQQTEHKRKTNPNSSTPTLKGACWNFLKEIETKESANDKKRDSLKNQIHSLFYAEPAEVRAGGNEFGFLKKTQYTWIKQNPKP
ncbi:hypothetical protein KSK37_06545 [Kaistella sp. DKR-2]|uniref:hypothetical protein n=1 Tax=Kaistella soli TaxID=2849654 RepID=UPI001C252A81|nr:hypothetical protein [Kaistella soli]MBU8882737.1 hypothetical protein [Kaistella soli]